MLTVMATKKQKPF